MSKATITMDELLASSDIQQLKAGDVVEGTITSVRKHEVWVDCHLFERLRLYCRATGWPG